LHDVLLSRIVVPAMVSACEASSIAPPLRKGGLGGSGKSQLDANATLGTQLDWDAPSWAHLYTSLAADRRATTLRRPHRAPLWAAAERPPAALAAFPDAAADPPLDVPEGIRRDWTAEDARVAMVRGLMEVCGPTTSAQIAKQLGIEPGQADACLEALE